MLSRAVRRIVAARRAQVTAETHCTLKDIRGIWSRAILSVGNSHQTRPMKMRFATAVLSLALLAGAAFAGDRSGPFQRSPLAPPALPGMRDPLDPVTYPPSSDASLPDLGGSEASRAS